MHSPAIASGELNLIGVALELDVPRGIPADNWSLFKIGLPTRYTLPLMLAVPPPAKLSVESSRSPASFGRATGWDGLAAALLFFFFVGSYVDLFVFGHISCIPIYTSN